MTLEEICKKAEGLPCSPGVLPQAVSLLGRDDTGLEDLEQVILRDPGLSAAVLRLANSATYGGAQKFDTLGDAIFRLGFKETYRLTVAVTGGRWTSHDLQAYAWEPGDFCRHSFAVGVSAQMVARASKACREELAYTAGLLHDAGKLALAFAAADTLENVRSQQAQTQSAWMDAEEAVLGFSHADITAQLFSNWGLPDSLVAVGKYYARPSQAAAAHRALVAVVHAGKHLAIQTGIGAGEDAFLTGLDDAAVASLGLDEQQLRDLLPLLIDELKKFLRKDILVGPIRFDN